MKVKKWTIRDAIQKHLAIYTIDIIRLVNIYTGTTIQNKKHVYMYEICIQSIIRCLYPKRQTAVSLFWCVPLQQKYIKALKNISKGHIFAPCIDQKVQLLWRLKQKHSITTPQPFKQKLFLLITLHLTKHSVVVMSECFAWAVNDSPE